MNVQWIDSENTYRIEEKLDNGQTFVMEFQEIDWNADTIYFNVYLAIYNKRTQATKDDQEAKTTGKNIFLKTWTFARQAFDLIEQELLREFNYIDNIVIYVSWSDNRRRDIYHHFLSKRGYRYGRDLDNKKVLYKKYTFGKD